MDGPVKGFSHAQLRVADVEASVAWYSTAVGLTPAGPPQSGAVAMYGAGGRFAIVISEGYTGGVHLDHLAFGVADRATLEAWADSLTEAGVPHEGVCETPVGFELHLRDPDGLDVELLVPKP